MPRLFTTAGPRLALACFLLAVVMLSLVGNVYGGGNVYVAPGKDAQKLGVDFPNFGTGNFGTVKLTYPNSSILTNNTGDLLFAVILNITISVTTKGCNFANLTYGDCRLSSVDIYLPPEFSNLAVGNLWTSFTNDYHYISLSSSLQSSISQGFGTGSVRGQSSIGPNLSKVSISSLNVTSNPALADPGKRTFLVVLNSTTGTYISEPQYIRLFQVKSPTIAGRYFFKAFINGTSIGAQNFPTIVVKASRDPAYISGTLRYARNVTAQLELPIWIPNGTGAEIVATGLDYFGRSVSAQTFINSSAQGRYTLFGVAPGTYNLTAYAAGFIPTTRPTSVSVLAEQSLEGVNIYMKESANVTGALLSTNCGGQRILWGSALNRTAASIQLRTLSGSVAVTFPAQFGGALNLNASLDYFPFSIQYQIGFDGRIPQNFAGYTSGLAAGDYLISASVNTYKQYDYPVIHVGNNTSLVRFEVPLVKLGGFFVTVHFKDFDSTLNETLVPAPGGTLTVQAYNDRGNVGGRNSISVPGNAYNSVVYVPVAPGTYHLFATFTGRGSGGNVADLYYQTQDVQASIGCGNVSLSFAMLRGGQIELTLYSIDTEKPAILRPWTFPGFVIDMNFVDSYGNLYTSTLIQPQHFDNKGALVFSVTASFAGFLTDNYSIFVTTCGYTQRDAIRLHVVQGGISDASVWMVQDPLVELTLVFKTEGLLSPIDSTLPYAQPINHLNSTPVRVEIFDAHGNFVGANRTYVENHNSTFKVTLAGFNRYYGNPRLTWSGFYDTTDGVLQDEGGLQPGAYQIRIWVDGYCQLQLIPVTLPSAGNVSIIYSMERASRVSGTVLGLESDQYPERLSWAVIDLESENFTFYTFSLDGNYSLWVPYGSYNMGVSLPGYAIYTARFEVPKGSDLKADIWLDSPRSATPYVASTLQTPGIWLILPTFTGLTLSVPKRAISKDNENEVYMFFKEDLG